VNGNGRNRKWYRAKIGPSRLPKRGHPLVMLDRAARETEQRYDTE
jgi:hypothetical protein